MDIIQTLIAISFSLGLFLILADRFRVPYLVTSKAVNDLNKKHKKKTGTVEIWLGSLAMWLSKHIRINEYKRMNIDILDEKNNNLSKHIITNISDIQYIKFYEEDLRKADVFLYNNRILQVDNKFINKYFYNLETLNYDEDMIILKNENYNLLSMIDKFEIVSVDNNVTLNLNNENDKNSLIKYLNKKYDKEINSIINLTDFDYQERNNKIITSESNYTIEKSIDTLSTIQLIISNNNLIILNKKKKIFN